MYGKIRVLGGWERLPMTDTAKDRLSPRLMAAYMDRPLLPENFSAEEVLDTWSGRTLQDWRTFHQAGTRLVDYLHYAGYNGLVLSVAADGSAIYPSQVLEPTPRYDTGVFFASGQDPMPKDVLEMLLRLMDRENLQLIPAIEFATPLPALEAIRRRGGAEAQGLEWIGADGKTWCQTYSTHRGLAPYYNTLDPRVQEAMLSAVRELVDRYAGHPSFRGLALRLSAYGYAQLPGPDWGMDDATVARFEHDSGVHVPGSGAKRFAARAAFLTSDEQCGRWLQWRAAECHKFYHRIQRPWRRPATQRVPRSDHATWCPPMSRPGCRSTWPGPKCWPARKSRPNFAPRCRGGRRCRWPSCMRVSISACSATTRKSCCCGRSGSCRPRNSPPRPSIWNWPRCRRPPSSFAVCRKRAASSSIRRRKSAFLPSIRKWRSSRVPPCC